MLLEVHCKREQGDRRFEEKERVLHPSLVYKYTISLLPSFLRSLKNKGKKERRFGRRERVERRA